MTVALPCHSDPFRVSHWFVRRVFYSRLFIHTWISSNRNLLYYHLYYSCSIHKHHNIIAQVFKCPTVLQWSLPTAWSLKSSQVKCHYDIPDSHSQWSITMTITTCQNFDCKLFKTISSSHKSSHFADVNFPKHKAWTKREFKSCWESLCFGYKVLNKCVVNNLLTAS